MRNRWFRQGGWIGSSKQDGRGVFIPRLFISGQNLFLKFVTKQRVRTDEVPSLGPEAITIVKNIKELISAWRKMSGIDTCPQTTEKILKTCDHRLTNEDLEDFR